MLLTAAHLLYLATGAGADALGLGGQIGDLSAGKQFDAVWLSPPAGSALAVGLTHAASPDDALSKVFALATPADVRAVWVAGARVTDKEVATSEMRKPDTV
jgi:guanine deaminase